MAKAEIHAKLVDENGSSGSRSKQMDMGWTFWT